MYHFFKNNRINKYFVYFLILSFFNSGYFAYSNELMKNYIKVKLNPQSINHYKGNSIPVFNPTDIAFDSPIPKIVSGKVVATKIKFENNTNNVICTSDLKEGSIGVSKKGDFDFIYDNIFKVNINENDLSGKEVYLSYDIKGIDKSTLPSRSVNFNKVVGGYVVKFSNEWQNVEEKISASWLKNGLNTIFFTLPNHALYNYRIKNLKISTRENANSNHLIELKNLIGYKNDDKNIYLNGFINLQNQLENSDYTLSANNKLVKITDNQFEDKLINIDNKNVELKLFKNKVLIDKIDVKVNQFIKADRNYDLETLDSKVNLNTSLTKNYAEYETKKYAIEELRHIDIPQFESSFINVTKNKTAYRVNNLKVKDSTDYKLFIEYDSLLIPNGYTEKDIQTFHFDRNYKKWIPVKKDSLIESISVVVALSNKDGDYVNGIIQAPESPQTSSFTPTMMSDIKAADPSSGMTLISPPEVSQKGDANISYPIKIPSGRNGMQPSLSINYSSDGGNGWLGEGWGISTPAITIDTKWGVPTFDPAKESEIYNLNGEQLMYPKSTNGQDWMPNRHQEIGGLYIPSEKNRSTGVSFTPRKQGSFTKIERLGNNTTDYYWKVTSTDGTISWYGGKTLQDVTAGNAVIKNNNGNIVHWALYMVEDVYGNNIKYFYNKVNFSTGTGENQNLNGGLVYNLSKIKYTGHNGSDGAYSVDFINETAVGRNDININTKFGLKQIMPYRLDKIKVSLNNIQIRSYKLEYIEGQFKKSLLNKVIENDNNDVKFYEHKFEYYQNIDTNSYFSPVSTVRIPEFSADFSMDFGNILKASRINSNETKENGWNVRPAIGLQLLWVSSNPKNLFTVGFPFGESKNKNDGIISFADIDGNGLDDIVFKKDNKLYYYPHYIKSDNDSYYGGQKEILNMSHFNKSTTKTKMKVFESFDFHVLNYYYGKRRTISYFDNTIYFSDANSDGLVDIVNENYVLFNSGENSSNQTVLTPDSAETENMVIVADANILDNINQENPDDTVIDNYDVVRVWEAPYGGQFKIRDTVAFSPTSTNSKVIYSIETSNSSINGGVPFRLYLKEFNSSTTTENISSDNFNSNIPSLGINSVANYGILQVKKGQKIFFRIHKNINAVNDKIDTSPTIEETKIQEFYDQNQYLTKLHNYSSDFKLSGNDEFEIPDSGTLKISWPTINHVNLSDNVVFKITKRVINSQNQISETVLYSYLCDNINTLNTFLSPAFLNNLSVNFNNLTENVSLHFSVYSDSNVRWTNINWYPKIEYTPQSENIEHGIKSFAKILLPEYSIYKDVVFSDNLVENTSHNIKANDLTFTNNFCIPTFYNVANTIKTYKVKPITFYNASSPYALNSTDNGEFMFVIKRNGNLIDKRKVIINNGVISLEGNQNPITFYSGNPTGQALGVSFEFYVKGISNENLFNRYCKAISYINCGTSSFLSGSIHNIMIGTQEEWNSFNGVDMSVFAKTYANAYSDSGKHLGARFRNWGQFIYNEDYSDNPLIPQDSFGKLIDNNVLNINQFSFGISFDSCQNLTGQNQTDCINNQILDQFNLPSTTTVIDGTNIEDIVDTVLQNPIFSNIPFNPTFQAMPPSLDLKNNEYVEKWIGIHDEQYASRQGVRAGNIEDSGQSVIVDINDNVVTPTQANLFTGMLSIKKSIESSADTYSASAGGWGSTILSKSKSRHSNKIFDFLDLNGDRYPDILTQTGIFSTSMTGGHINYSSSFNTYPIDSSTHNLTSLSGNRNVPTSGRRGVSESTNDNGNASFNLNLNVGVNLNLSGNNHDNNYLFDVNGDGLLDKVIEVSDNNFITQFNYGNHFSNLEVFNNLSSNTTSPTTFSPSVSATFSFGSGGFNISASIGGAVSGNNVDVTFSDINGDGLNDLILSTGFGVFARVNLGNKFDNTLIPLHFDFNNTSFNYSLSFAIQASYYFGFSICCYILPILYLKFGVEANYSGSLSVDEKRKDLNDYNGDGFPDFIEKDQDEAIRIRYNTLGKINRLKSVTNPLGGSFVLDYKNITPTYNNPNSSWVLNTVTINDGRDVVNDGVDSYSKSFVYSNAKYDRRERAFYGYETVETLEKLDNNITRKTVAKHHNSSYFLNGLVKETAVYKVLNGNEILYSKTENTYEIKATASSGLLDINTVRPLTFDVGGKEGRRQAAVLLTKTVNNIYEFGTTPLTSEINFKYDGYGRVKEYTNKGNVAYNTDDYKSVITYQTGLSNNLINIPKKIEVFTGTTLSNSVRVREVTSVNSNTGDVLSVKVLLNLYNDYAQTDMTYDIYGNLKTVTYPQTSFGQQIYTYTYDTILHKYLIEVEDVLGYKSSTLYDYNFDVVRQSTDITGNKIIYDYDNIGRLTKIIAPKEANNPSPYTISFDYMPTYAQLQSNTNYASFVSQANFIPFAVTKHYDAQHPTDPIETINFIDGLGRNIQVKKDIEVNTGTPSSPTYSQQMSVSGYVTNDILGRNINTYQPRSENKSNTINYLINQATTPISSFSMVEYDVLDRTTKSIDFEGNVSSMSYSIANDPFGTLAFKTRSVVQQNGTTDIINESFTDIKGQNISTLNAGSIKTKFNYDAIGQLISYTDDQNISTTYEYDYVGNKIIVYHPDNGTTRYIYNRVGNIEEIMTDNISQAGGDPINYEYDSINRLIAIKYPILPYGGDNIANVKYKYAAPGSGNNTGRIIEQIDATGWQEFNYGNMGETTNVKRTIVAPNLPTRNFTSSFNYDSFNRIQNLTYPDGEKVNYFYNKGGNLNKMTTLIDLVNYDFIKQIDYDYFEQKTYMKYGNNTETFYRYTPELRRLQTLKVKAADGQNLFSNKYSYDKVGNVINIQNSATHNTINYMGGTYNNEYTYDNLNRLTKANGSFSGYGGQDPRDNPTSQKSYHLSMKYNTTHGIVEKNQQHMHGNTSAFENTYNNIYKYQTDTHKVTNITNSDNNLTENFEYDANGNMVYNHNPDGFRRMYWDESNRLRIVNDNDHVMQHYIYDANGERILKASSQIESVYENGQIDSSSTTMGLYTTYVSPYMVVDANQRYSKHYFNGSQRVASRIGNEDISIFETQAEPLVLEKQTQNQATQNSETTDLDALKNLQISDFNYYLGKNTNKGKKVKVKYAEYKKVEEPVENTAAKTTENNTQMMMPVNIEVYYYHSDHLGTGTFLSDGDGNPYQFFLNLPFGETMTEQHSYTGNYTNKYKFNGKELDEETGFYYYGARYYNPKFSIWLSTDPLAEMFPNWNPYNYCFNNPIMFSDPTGMAPEDGDGDPPVKGATTKAPNGDTLTGDGKNWIDKNGVAVDPDLYGIETVTIEKTVEKSNTWNDIKYGYLSFANASERWADDTGKSMGQFVANSLPPIAFYNAGRSYTSGKDIYGNEISKAQGTAQAVVSVLPFLKLGKLVPLGLGSTGRTVAGNLMEEMAMESVMKNPALGRVVEATLGDPRWLGWTKMHYSVTSSNGIKTVIHYVAKIENGVIKAVDDFKFK